MVLHSCFTCHLKQYLVWKESRVAKSIDHNVMIIKKMSKGDVFPAYVQ